ncbi:hypothetical protein E2C01_068694 [Portunus trituberculatus]|uniref:Uncharacterized protein n=1 Tax=Portunus trituberculatus TaxID=210409 RepID=A0A5B7HX84_PORTR|nr:hypothetical protein [Portunus trituberculatus]
MVAPNPASESPSVGGDQKCWIYPSYISIVSSSASKTWNILDNLPDNYPHDLGTDKVSAFQHCWNRQLIVTSRTVRVACVLVVRCPRVGGVDFG